MASRTVYRNSGNVAVGASPQTYVNSAEPIRGYSEYLCLDPECRMTFACEESLLNHCSLVHPAAPDQQPTEYPTGTAVTTARDENL